MSTVVRQPGFCFLSIAVHCWKSNQISLSFCCRINESNGYFCPKQINNSSVPFRPEIPLKRNSKFFFYHEQNHCFIFLLPLQPADNWKSTFVCHSNDLIKIHMNSIESNLWRCSRCWRSNKVLIQGTKCTKNRVSY